MRDPLLVRQSSRLAIIDTGDDGFAAVFTPYTHAGSRKLNLIVSWGGNWEHASVCPNRPWVGSVSQRIALPTWEEMCAVKRLVWHDGECVMQLHPPEAEYVDDNPLVLHLWRPTATPIPMPPKSFV